MGARALWILCNPNARVLLSAVRTAGYIAPHVRQAACGWELNAMRSHTPDCRRKHANRAAQRHLRCRRSPPPLLTSLQSSGQRQWPQPQHGVAAAISRRLLTGLPHRTTLTTREQPPPVPAAQRPSRSSRKAIGHIDVRRTAGCANPWLCGMCEHLVRLGGVLRTVLHHLLQELHDDLGGRTDQHLALATLLGIEDAAKAVVQHRDAHHPEAGGAMCSEPGWRHGRGRRAKAARLR